jgi:hypothetical protein
MYIYMKYSYIYIYIYIHIHKYLGGVTQNINRMTRQIGDRWAFELGFGGKGAYLPAQYIAQEEVCMCVIYTCICMFIFIYVYIYICV